MSNKKESRDFKERKKRFDKSMENWTDEELQEHIEQVDKYYGTGMQQANFLGDFSNDPNNVYYWHVVDKDHENKLKRRKAIGWSPATQEDIKGAGITTTSKYGDIGGESVVIANHGGDSKAILLKIPKKLYELNQEAKRASSNRQSGLDVHGELARIRDKKDGHKIVRHRDEGEISL